MTQLSLPLMYQKQRDYIRLANLSKNDFNRVWDHFEKDALEGKTIPSEKLNIFLDTLEESHDYRARETAPA